MENNLIKLFCVVILIILNVAVIINGLNLSCNKCQLVVYQTSAGQTSYQYVNLTDVYNQYLNGNCLIERSGKSFIVHGLP